MLKQSKIEKLIETAPVFEVDAENGLTSEQVKSRVKGKLTNKIVKRVTKSYIRIFYENVVNAWNILLFAIAALMIYAKIEIANFVFLLVLIFNICVGLYQDIRARKLVDKLKVLDYPRVKVIRDGKEIEITANKLVLSDAVQIKMGNQIPCDGTLLEGTIEVNESMLTGEADNITKKPGDKIYSGSYVTAGNGIYRVDQLGKANYAEKLQSKARKFKKPKSEIITSIHRIFKSIGGAVAILAIALFVSAYLREELPLPPFKNTSLHFYEDGRPCVDIYPFMKFRETIRSISGALVAMVPIGMYLLTTITLAVGVIRLANKQMLTQDMYSLEMLARADILCLDKTGTLTDGQMNVYKLFPTAKVSERDLGKMLYTIVDGTGDENPTATAIRKHFCHLNKFDIVKSVPFNSAMKYSGVILEDGRNIVLGAREFVPHSDKKVDSLCSEYENKGCRVLVIALSDDELEQGKQLKNCKIIGIIILQDHIRDDAYENIEWFKKSGVGIRIITGDNPASASEIAKRAGIEEAEKYISLEGMSVDDVRLIARDYRIYGRVSPEQKEAIIQALKDDGHTVAMTGDGVNDILALRVADCSIAMASGSDAAKNVAHLVSLDSNFSALPAVVKEGRRVINNLQRAVSIYLVKTVFAMVLTVFFLIWGMIDKNISYPFETKNMYIWEMINIGVGSLFLSLQPNEEQIKSSFMSNILSKVLPASMVQITIVIFLYLIAYVFKGQIINIDTVNSLAVVSFTIGSFIILVRVCMPFDAYRALLVIGLGFVDLILVFSDYHYTLSKELPNGLLGINYSIFEGGVTNKTSFVLLLTIIFSIVSYVFFEYISTKLHNRYDKKKEEAKYENF